MEAKDWKDKGNALVTEKKYEKALFCYTMAIEKDPKEPIFYSNRSAMYLNLNQFIPSLEDAEKAISLKSNYPKAYFRKGQALERLNRLEEALDAYKKGLIQDKTNEQLLQAATKLEESLYNHKKADEKKEIGDKEFKKKNYDKALRYYQEAIDLYPKDIVYYLDSAKCYLNKKDYDKAIELSRYVCDNTYLFSKRGAAFGIIGYAYRAQNKLDKAIKAFEDSLVVYDDATIKEAKEETIKLQKKLEAGECINPKFDEDEKEKEDEDEDEEEELSFEPPPPPPPPEYINPKIDKKEKLKTEEYKNPKFDEEEKYETEEYKNRKIDEKEYLEVIYEKEDEYINPKNVVKQKTNELYKNQLKKYASNYIDEDFKDEGIIGKKSFEENRLDIPHELYKFLKIFPCVLKLGSSNNVETYNSCLNEIPKINIEFQEENKFSSMKIENNDNIDIINNTQISSGLSFLYNDVNFKNQLTKSKRYERHSSSYIIKRKLYSITIKEEDITFRPFFSKKIEKIAYSFDSDKEKAQKLDELFKEIGFYIPLKAYVGGLYNLGDLSEKQINEFENIFGAQLNLKMKYNVNEQLENKFRFNKIKDHHQNSKIFIGGQICDTIEEWINSLNLSNSDIIEYTEFRSIYNFIDDDLSMELKGPIELIKQKYERRQNYFDIIKELEKNKGDSYYTDRTNSLKIGICEIKNPSIYCYDELGFYEDYEFMSIRRTRKNIYKGFNDIIIGLEIDSNWNDGTNGKFTLDNPILTKEINIDFISQRRKEMGFNIKVYLMKLPD